MKIYLKYIIIVLVILLVVQLALKLSHKKKTNEVITTEFIMDFDEEEISRHVGKRIQRDDIIIDSHNDTLSLSELSESDSLFIIRYSSLSCESCKDFAQNTALDYDLPSKYKVNLIIADIPVRDLHVLESLNKNISFYKADLLESDFDDGLTPYSMILYNDTIRTYFIPHKELPQEYHKFIQNIINKTL